MSTRAFVGMTLPNQTIITINCFHDAYPKHLGRILTENYNTEAKIEELMKGGDLTDIEITPELCNYEHKGKGPVAESNRPVTYHNFEVFIKKAKEYIRDYAYLFHDGQWHTYDPFE